jgi:hypothetical protein
MKSSPIYNKLHHYIRVITKLPNSEQSYNGKVKLSEVNVKDTFTSHIDKKNIFDIFVDTLSLYIFTI